MINYLHILGVFYALNYASVIFYMYICGLLNICTNNFRAIAKYKLGSH